MSQYQRESSNTLGPFDNQNKTQVLDQFLVLCELPFDTIAFVAQKMHLSDCLNFRSTCKQFRSMIPIIRSRKNNMYPLLLLFNRNKATHRLLDPCTNDSCHIKLCPELDQERVEVDFSMAGWLLLRTNNRRSLHFYNPFTKVGGEFPPCDYLTYITSVGFSSCPTSPECVTVGICFVGNVRLCYHRFKEERWHVLDIDLHDDCEFRVMRNSPVYHKGAFYFLDSRGYLGVFELVNEKVCWDIYDKPETPRGHYLRHLVECDGELLSVCIGDMGRWVRVFKFNQKRLRWFRVKSIGNYVLYVGRTSSFSIVANEREMRNRIYLPRLHSNEIIFYALDTCKYGTLSPMGEEPLKDLYGTGELVHSVWI